MTTRIETPWDPDRHHDLNTPALDAHLTDALGADVSVWCSTDDPDDPDRALIIEVADLVAEADVLELLNAWDPPAQPDRPVVALAARIDTLE